MSTPESRAKDKIKRVLDRICAQRGLKHRIDWNAGSAYMNTLDGVGVVAGHPVAIEVKRFDENEKPTDRQRINMREFAEAGAAVFDIIDETSLAYFVLWLETLEPREPHAP